MTGAEAVRRVAIVTDSSACLPAAEIEAHRVEIVPIVLVWDGVELRDGIDITPDAFWRRLATDQNLPTTSSMSPGEYAVALAAARRWADSAVCLCIPRSLSTMYEAAELAAAEIDREFPVSVIETGGAAMASGFPALLAARAAGAGAAHDQVVAAATRAAAHSEIVAVLDSLEYLARTGRIPGIVARLADAVPSKFVLRLERGNVSVRARFGSRERAINGMLNRIRRKAADATYIGVAVHHGANRAEAEDLADRIRREFQPDDLYITSFTPVMGTHVGPGLIGLACCAI